MAGEVQRAEVRDKTGCSRQVATYELKIRANQK